MKSILLVAALTACSFVFAQTPEALIASMKSGNAAGVAKHFEQNIEMTLLKNSGTFSKTQAEGILKDFFAKRGVRGFDVNHQGTSPEGARYYVGTLNTAAGSYSAYLFGKQNGGVFLIRELRVEEK